MNNKTLELRNIDVELQGTDSETGELLVSGYVNRTDEWSKPLGREKRFIERIKPQTFTRALQKGNEINFLAEHDNSKILASTKNGSLSLREDEIGLYMEARISATSWGKDYHQLISDGLVTNMSFGMQVVNDRWEKRSDGMYERTINELYLSEVSVVRNPAYAQSSIQARSLDVKSEDELFLMQKNNNEKAENIMTEKEIKEMRALLEKAEAEQRAGVVEEKTEKRATEVEDKEAIEIRGVEQFLRGNMLAPEVRELSTGTQSILVPTSISNHIVEKLVEQASLFGRAKTFQPVSGTLEVLREVNIDNATFIGEMENASKADFSFDKIVLEQRRAATAIELSQQLVNDSGINVIEYAVNVMTRRLSRELDKSVLVGDKANKQFEGILTSATAQVVGTHAAIDTITDAVLADKLLDLTLSVHPNYLEGAVFVVGRPMFNRIAKIKDAQGNYMLIRDIANGRPAYKFLGHEILIQENMPALATGTITVAFVNFGEAYATMIKKGASFKKISDDTTQALRGSHLLLLDVYADGKILNENAIKFLKQV